MNDPASGHALGIFCIGSPSSIDGNVNVQVYPAFIKYTKGCTKIAALGPIIWAPRIL